MSLNLKRFLAGVFVPVLLGVTAWSQAPAKNWKDRAEYDLVQKIQGTTDPKAQLDLVNQWKDKYPTTDFQAERTAMLLGIYQKLGDAADMRTTARDMLTTDPNGFGNYWLTVLTVSQASTSEADLAEGEKAANGLLANLDTIYSKEKMPALKDDELAKTKKAGEIAAHQTLAYIARTRKNLEAQEAEDRKLIELNPNSGDVPYDLGGVLIGEKKPEKYPEALYYIARAVGYSGAGELPADAKAKASAYLQKIYITYHGSKDGLDQLIAQAKTSPNPPAGFTVISAADIQKQQIDKQNEDMKNHPELALWQQIKGLLTAPDGETYFANTMKGTEVPKLQGKLVSFAPAVRPTHLVLAMSGDTPEVTLVFTPALTGKADPGTVITFDKGIAAAFTKEPFNLTFDVKRSDMTGWPVAAAAPAHKAPVHHRAH